MFLRRTLITCEEYFSKRESNCRCIDGFRYNELTNRRIWEGTYETTIYGTTNVFLYKKFRNLIEAADLCIVIGFSFRDEHVNAIFSDFFRRGRSIIVLSRSVDKNVYTNFLKMDIAEPEETVQSNSDDTSADYPD